MKFTQQLSTMLQRCLSKGGSPTKILNAHRDPATTYSLQSAPPCFSKPAAAAAAFSRGARFSTSAAPPTSADLLYSVVESPGHRLEDHVERPQRVRGILRHLEKAGFTGPNTAFNVRELPADRLATAAEIALVHTYGGSLTGKCAAATPQAPIAVADLGDPDGVTYLTKSSYTDACRALGASLQLVDAVVQASKEEGRSSAPAGFAVVRPPGHHACPETPLGYCLLNNVAVAARYAQQRHGLKKVFILDFDVHNGNGTCEAFWEDPSVLVADIHEENTVYPAPDFIPSGAEDIGEGAGKGYTVNVPLPRYAGHEAAVAVWREVVLPAVIRFQPGLILCSAGYDAHLTDPFQLLQMRSSTYHFFAKELKTLADKMCDGRLIFFLEGGYDADALGDSVVETWLALVGQPSREAAQKVVLARPEPLAEVRILIDGLKQIHGMQQEVAPQKA